MPYISQAFDVQSFKQAKHVALSEDPAKPEKFEEETAFLVEAIAEQVPIGPDTVALDFGCGMGRVSRELIERFSCRVIGVDISPSMLAFARIYVAHKAKFLPVHAWDEPKSIDFALASFVLQHVEDPAAEIDRLYEVIRPGGWLVVLNETKRFVPSGIDRMNFVLWEDDHFDVFAHLERAFTKVATMTYLNSTLNIGFYRKAPQSLAT